MIITKNTQLNTKNTDKIKKTFIIK